MSDRATPTKTPSVTGDGDRSAATADEALKPRRSGRRRRARRKPVSPTGVEITRRSAIPPANLVVHTDFRELSDTMASDQPTSQLIHQARADRIGHPEPGAECRTQPAWAV